MIEKECIICDKSYPIKKIKSVRFKHWLIPEHLQLKDICKKCLKELKENIKYGDDEMFIIQIEEVKND